MKPANISDASYAVTAQVALKLENMSKSFGGITVLKGVSFAAKAGRVLAIMGENGVGKSTLKNIMCGLLSPDQEPSRWPSTSGRSSPAPWRPSSASPRCIRN